MMEHEISGIEVSPMPNIYRLAIPFLLVACISVAQADQNVLPIAAKAVAKKTATPVTSSTPEAASSPAAATTAIPPAEITPAPVPATASLAAPVIAALKEQEIIKFGGFGSLGFAHSSQNSGDYVLDSSVPKGVGRSSNFWPGNNSRAAAHISGNFTPQLSGIFQVDTEYRTDGTYRPEIEWLNVKYAFTPNTFMRVGRIALQTFIDSENHDVGYSYVWVNPPVDLYHQLSIAGSDGLDFGYRSEIGQAGNTIKAIYGSNVSERPTSKTTSKDMWGIFDTFEYGPTTLHFSYQQRRTQTKNLLTGSTGEWTQNSDISIGGSYDPGNWFVISEWMQRRSTTKISAMYVSGGCRIDKFTPYVLYSQNSPGSFYASATPPSASAVERAKRSQRTTTLGLRWDFMRNYDFKLQLDQVKLSDDSNGYLINVPKNVNLHGHTFYVVTTVVDFVF